LYLQNGLDIEVYDLRPTDLHYYYYYYFTYYGFNSGWSSSRSHYTAVSITVDFTVMILGALQAAEDSQQQQYYKVGVRLRVINNTVHLDKPGLVMVWLR